MIPNLQEIYKPYFKIGAAVNKRTVNTHKDLLMRHFNSLTCENEMKYASVCAKEGEYNFAGADTIYKFALENNMEMRGHTLVWHNQSPNFVFQEKDRLAVMDTLRNHMQTMAERYDKGVYAWDVVNEAIEDKNEEYLRKTKWMECLGESYMEDVFTIAKGIFKNKDLYYNDYNENNTVKRGKIIKLIRNLLDKNVPINGIGLQGHHNIYEPPIDQIKESIEAYAELGIKISITEMDISMFRFDDHSSLEKPSEKMIELQAECYRQCFKIYREYSEHIDSVTLWGIADDVNWLDSFPVKKRKNWPLLFDENHEPKEAFWRIINL